MSKTLHTNDRVFTINLFYTPHKDDVVIFNAVANYSDDFYIKRIIATEGNLVEFTSDGILYVDGEYAATLRVIEYETITESIGLSKDDTSFTVPKNKVLVFGDNRPGSCDSRSFGFIDSKDIYGKVFLRMYPNFGGIGKNIIE